MSRRGRIAGAAGFTLVELMVVVVIIGLLSSIALIAIDPGKKSRTPRGFAESLAARFDFARQRAIATQSVQRVTLGANSVLYHAQAPEQGMLTDAEITAIDTADTWEQIGYLSPPPAVGIVEFKAEADLDGGYAATAGTGLDAFLYFRPDGSVGATGTFEGGTVYIADDSRSQALRVVIFRITGAVEVYEGW